MIGSPRATPFKEITARLSNYQRCFGFGFWFFFFTTSRLMSGDSMQSMLEGLFALHMLSHPLQNTGRKRRWHISTSNSLFWVRGDVSCELNFIIWPNRICVALCLFSDQSSQTKSKCDAHTKKEAHDAPLLVHHFWPDLWTQRII